MTAIKKGDVYMTRGGAIVTIDYENPGLVYPFGYQSNGTRCLVTDDGRYFANSDSISEFDLVERIGTTARPEDLTGPSASIDLRASIDDMNELATETLLGLGWHFDGKCWVQDGVQLGFNANSKTNHPLYSVFIRAIEQAMFGKGERHGGAQTPFFDQPWQHYAKMHGRGFLTGQAAKKLEEAASTRNGDAFETEILGAMVYLGMAVLNEGGAK